MSADAPEDERSEEARQRWIAELQAELARLKRQAPSRVVKKVSVRKTTRSATPEPTVHTEGGAVVRGSVRVDNGHFIGRDFVQIVGADRKLAPSMPIPAVPVICDSKP